VASGNRSRPHIVETEHRRHITANTTEEIELNFRDEKTLLGFGQPQVRNDPAVRTTATFFVFA
jgi:hypothetical protein